jgi:hypothetical protein
MFGRTHGAGIPLPPGAAVLRRFATAALLFLVLVGTFLAIAYRNARADPIVRHAAVALPDWPTGAAPSARILRWTGIAVLVNDARARGPVALVGLDDRPTHHARLASTLHAMNRPCGAGIMVAHSPGIAPSLPARIRLLLAGHTHCGRVVLALIGPPVQVTIDHYRCGLIRDTGRTTIVMAGLGTSNLSIRYGAPPDLWLARVGPRVPTISPPRP